MIGGPGQVWGKKPSGTVSIPLPPRPSVPLRVPQGPWSRERTDT
jgi:hypothetical protein